MRRAALVVSASLIFAGCSLALDFDDETDLPCPCLPSHVCLVSSNRCVPRNSVENYKSCNPDAERPDDLCLPNSICFNFQDKGPRCLPQCTPSSYTTPEASQEIGQQCAIGYTCWQSERGGVCSEGVCEELRQNCTPPQRCVAFNGAGVCFTPCRIFQPDACAGDQTCHPIGDSSVAACSPFGTRQESPRFQQPCSHQDPCVKTTEPPARLLVCDKPRQSTDVRRCLPICQCGGGVCSNNGCAPDETCLFARERIDLDTQTDLGVCVRN